MILLLTILFPIISGIIISIPEMENRKRHIFYIAALFITDILGAVTILNGGSARLFAFTVFYNGRDRQVLYDFRHAALYGHMLLRI